MQSCSVSSCSCSCSFSFSFSCSCSCIGSCSCSCSLSAAVAVKRLFVHDESDVVKGYVSEVVLLYLYLMCCCCVCAARANRSPNVTSDVVCADLKLLAFPVLSNRKSFNCRVCLELSRGPDASKSRNCSTPCFLFHISVERCVQTPHRQEQRLCHS